MAAVELTPLNVPNIGNILYKLRERQEISQKDVATHMRKSQTQVSIMEHSSKIPGLAMLCLYLAALDCKLVILVDEEVDQQVTKP